MRTTVVDEVGAETFNSVLVPFLSLYTIALTGGLAAFFGAIYGIKAFSTREKKETNFKRR